ncbi:hypothetical protein HZF08_14480 [Paenibacillus sp. CGMCC 1.16610]|uniref:Uncharacterized protein n=1 Tax=Paenibacillus anseongense TaxID=2682845 RepID=A0ABW9UIM4_9BACL|nr:MULTISPECIES: hypothetical protein [Paenibacillus]MBA2939518.1 hypothetical protein [Paenibacillus sp. CGMCC 1.16610]MVQ39181.1 hypothetical protein [Paenibacillus anseongense]
MKLTYLRGGSIAIIAIAALIVGVKALLTIQNINRITNVELVGEQTIYGKPGSQMIVRMGKTVAVATDKEGIPDLTAGLDLQPGTSIPDNHLLFFPKTTRGLQADLQTDNEIWITVRGGYTVYNESGKKIKPIIE